MNNGKFIKYIINTITLLKQLARKAKLESENLNDGSNDYIKGIIMGYYSIITLLKHEAFIFCIDQKELNLADIKPDIDLLNLSRNPDIDFEEDNWATDVINEEKIKRYLSDSISLLKDQAKKAKKEADNSEGNYKDYNKGELMAYCSLFSLLRHQASVFNIDEKELGITDID